MCLFVLLYEIKLRYAKLEEINNKIKTSQGISDTDDEQIEIGSSEWLLKQAETIKTQVDAANLSGSTLPREIAQIITQIQQLLGSDANNPGSISKSAQKSIETNLQNIVKRLAEAKLAAPISSDDSIGTKAKSIWKQSYAKSLSEAMRFHNAVLSIDEDGMLHH